MADRDEGFVVAWCDVSGEDARGVVIFLGDTERETARFGRCFVWFGDFQVTNIERFVDVNRDDSAFVVFECQRWISARQARGDAGVGPDGG